MYTEIIITQATAGSEDGMHVKHFKPSDEPQSVESNLAAVFIATGCAHTPKAKEASKPTEDKIVAPASAKVTGPKETK